MSGRDDVANPILLSPDEPGLQRFQFVALDTYTPRGIVTQASSDVSVHSFPTFAEIVGRYSDREGKPVDLWWCVTRMPVVGTDFELLAACIDSAPESLFRVLSGRDYGDALAKTLARDWPDIYAMLQASTAGQLDRRLLLAVDASGGRQWFVADVVVGEARKNLDASQVEDLIITALSVAIRTSGWITELPGILELGPDFATRRRTAIAGVLSGVADIGGAIDGLFTGQLKPADLASAAKAAQGFPDHVRSMFR